MEKEAAAGTNIIRGKEAHQGLTIANLTLNMILNPV